MKDAVEIQPVEIAGVFPAEPQQGAGLVAEDLAVGGQGPAPLVGGGFQGGQGLVQKAEVEIQATPGYGQDFGAHPGLPFLVGFGPSGLEGRVRVKGSFMGQGDHLRD